MFSPPRSDYKSLCRLLKKTKRTSHILLATPILYHNINISLTRTGKTKTKWESFATPWIRELALAMMELHVKFDKTKIMFAFLVMIYTYVVLLYSVFKSRKGNEKLLSHNRSIYWQVRASNLSQYQKVAKYQTRCLLNSI